MLKLLVPLLILLAAFSVRSQMTDVQREGYRGNVKSVKTWSQDVYPKASNERDFERDFLFDKDGRLLEDVFYFGGQRTKHFVLEGANVSLSEYFSNDPRVKLQLLGSIDGGVKKKVDSRYETKYIYKFDSNNRLAESREVNNDGSLNSRTEFSYDNSGLLSAEVDYDENGKKSSENSYSYDSSGNVIREVWVSYGDVDKKTTYYSYSDYKFDQNSNWTYRKRTTYINKKQDKIEEISSEHRDIKFY